MDKNQVINRLKKLPQEIAIAESEFIEQEQALRWSRLNLHQKKNELRAMLAIAKLI